MHACDFEYDGLYLSDFGFVICNFNGGSGVETISVGSKISFNTTSKFGGKKHSLTGTTYDECIETSFDICKDPSIHDDLRITDTEYRDLIRWLNRRGFYTSVLCRNCGEVIKCPNCDIPMIYHSEDKTIKCHWCDTSKKVPDLCPKCGSPEIKMTGMGTQRVENITAKLFPNAKVERIDSDALSSKTKYIDILDRFQNGEIDILIGTQMIAKGHDFPNVTLVGIVLADIGLTMPSYRSSERTFQLITQVAGRAGRSSTQGRVILQTYSPRHYVYRFATNYDYQGFFKKETNLLLTFQEHQF